ncbi:peroxiredoxin-like family protein [Ferrimonas aestuarii]|uniref:thioredoxin-dependent peroxiredoxin n=1 Tax=Ferrimonas aestuarii TaxID=2569539 RepID=A0A4U1BVZ9_9GAMM|nr:peroxiredoxin-like family protein [Ferrimonas aestuarii]TKB58604.1 AhpC/TSA family protein [Ferrimonas aestuarii]
MNKIITLLLALSSFTLSAAIAPSETQIQPLLNGMTIPDSQLTNADGQRQSLGQWTDGKPSLLVFYRGGWCPYCNAQLAGLAKIEAQLNRLGVQIIAISPDAPSELKQAGDELNYQLLSDTQLATSEAFGIAYLLSPKLSKAYINKLGSRLVQDKDSQRAALPVPAVYLVDGKGLVHFSYLNPNYKVRVEPELVLTAAKLMVD